MIHMDYFDTRTSTIRTADISWYADDHTDRMCNDVPSTGVEIEYHSDSNEPDVESLRLIRVFLADGSVVTGSDFSPGQMIPFWAVRLVVQHSKAHMPSAEAEHGH